MFCNETLDATYYDTKSMSEKAGFMSDIIEGTLPLDPNMPNTPFVQLIILFTHAMNLHTNHILKMFGIDGMKHYGHVL